MNEWEWQLLEDKNLLDHVTIAGIDIKAIASGLSRAKAETLWTLRLPGRLP